MAINTNCPQCRAAYQLAATQEGKNVRCKHCDAIFVATQAAPRSAAVRKAAGTPPVAQPRGRTADAARRKPAIRRTDEYEAADQTQESKGSSYKMPLLIGCGIASALVVLASLGGAGWYVWSLNEKNEESSQPSAPPTLEPMFRPPPQQMAAGPEFAPAKDIPPADPQPAPKQAGPDQLVQGQPVVPPNNSQPKPDLKQKPEPVEEEPAKPASNGNLSKSERERVKAATAYLRVTMADGAKMMGTGFFGCAEAPNIILTNAHVVGMLSPDSPRPQKIEVFVHSGEANEWHTAATVLGVDRSSDLAVLDIRERSNRIPKPLTVKSADALQELDTVYVFGFPLGEQLGKEITIRPSSVSSLRKKGGVLDRVQVNGGMDPGNSGGPVVDHTGAVVGVAVSGIPGRQINFAIPGERVHTILNGRISGLSYHQTYFTPDNKVAVPVLMEMIDPRNLIKEVGVEIWTGEKPAAGEAIRRPPTTTQPTKQSGDSARVYYKLKYTAPEGRAEIILPELPPGKVYWHQPRWVGSKGEMRWAAGNVLNLVQQPVYRKPANLVLRYPRGASRPVSLTLDNSFKVSSNDDNDTARTHTEVDLLETVMTSGSRGSQLTLSYRSIPRRELRLPGKQPSPSGTLERIKNDLRRYLVSHVQVDSVGNITQQFVDQQKLFPVLQTNPQHAQMMTDFHQIVQQGLESLSVSLPARGSINPLDSWKAERHLPIDTPGKFETGRLDVTFTYMGVRKRDGREEAVITMDGMVRSKDGVTGKGSGQILVDVATGQTTLAKSTVVLQLDALLSEPGEANRILRVILTMDVKMERRL